ACQLPPPGDPSGTIEVCKDAANGMSGRAFSFTLNGGSSFTVNGGQCSGPKSVTAGNVTVTEATTNNTEVQDITSAGHLVSKSIATSSAVVSVAANSTAANETLVRYFNQPLGGNTGQLKVCKQATTSLVGSAFSFTQNGGPATSVVAGPVGSPNCTDTTTYPVGTNVNVAELGVTNTFVSSISVSDGRGSNVNTAARTATATIGAGVTIVTYSNDVVPIPQTGYIEVCKSAADGFTSGAFNFAINGPSFSDTETVQVGQCTGPILVPAGNINVAEANRFPFSVSDISTNPSGRLVTSNLVNGTSTVSVPVSSSSADETMVTYTNRANLGQVKVCKTLDANATALAGQTFTFDVTSAAGASAVSVVAGNAGTTSCKLLAPLPLGSVLTATERAQANVRITNVAVTPASADAGTANPTAKLTVQPGVSTATFTNQALGTVEVCKVAADASTATQTFQFSVNGAAAINVRAGGCSAPIVVPAGTATVNELAKANFTFVSSAAVGPDGTSRVVSGTNPVTVSVPFGGVSNETSVTFTNRVNTGVFKVCKTSSDSSLPMGTVFSFTTTGASTAPLAVAVGDCSAQSVAIPVVNPAGQPNSVTVTEAAAAGTVLQSASAAGAGTQTATPANGVSFTIGQGVTIATFNNLRTPFVPAT
ncbi:MAG: hypothetical protein M3Z46_10190, partial [Actinomycetota bacterium]|nr:hypothetical protein [Actinomycetota bacterium]